MADKAAAYGVAIADISEETRARLPERRFSAILTNPFDFGALGNNAVLRQLCAEFAADPANDFVMMLLLEQARRKEYTDAVCDAAASQGKLMAAMVGEIGEPTLELFRLRGVPTFQSIDACMGALAALIRATWAREPAASPAPAVAQGQVAARGARARPPARGHAPHGLPPGDGDEASAGRVRFSQRGRHPGPSIWRRRARRQRRWAGACC